MKYCPQCHQNFADDSPATCRNDGSVLEVSPSSELLQVTSAVSFTSETKPLTPIVHEESPKVIRQHIVNPVPLLIAIGLICSIAIAAIMLIQNSGSEKESSRQDIQKNVSVGTISRSEIDRFISEWKQSWESRNIEAYSQYYADSFVGNNYSAKRNSTTMNRSEWLNDKKQKFQQSGEILVMIGAATVIYDGNDAVISFPQDYRSGDYKDYGNKTLRLRKQSNGTIKIAQEDFTPTLKTR